MTTGGDKPACGKFVSWWDGEYEGNCELPYEHAGLHFDGMSWYDDDGEQVDEPDNADTLGLTAEQRTHAEMLTLGGELMDKIRKNMEAWDALPPGTLIMCPACRVPHPVEVYR